ncbi:DUF6602 domain-containing protein [Burkholderia sp. A9]|uniref:DUF6602 domain-containing protein n=1 Tax=Burkholderia sp. A9 TaxID=1365108 RepID=UPI00069371C6|nr:DUF6602 domain-containing protein [Burkholderia sp. A9]
MFVTGQIYDPFAPWEKLWTGVVFQRDGNLHVLTAPIDEMGGGKSVLSPLSLFDRPFGYNVLVDPESWRNAGVNVAEYFSIVTAINSNLRDAENFQLPIDELLRKLEDDVSLTKHLIEDTIRMYAAVRYLELVPQKSGVKIKLSREKRAEYERRSYLRSFAEELVTKSRRIDSLIGHSGTKGSYRETLLRSMLKRLLPSRYHVDTGFIEDCPRQLDVIVWDGTNYPALFREADVVVVPRSSVRAVIEVKTTLEAGSLKEAVEIISDAFRTDHQLLPIFKGVFAFETSYVDERDGVRNRLKELFNQTDKDGEKLYPLESFYAGITAVCVPSRTCVLQGYGAPADDNSFPQPCLVQPATVEPGDWQTARFLQTLLEHLVLESEAKAVAVRQFSRTANDVSYADWLPIFKEQWRPTKFQGADARTLYAPIAKSYVDALEGFFDGTLDAQAVLSSLGKLPD